MTQKKKPNKAARMQKKAHDAETFEKGFSMGYGMGYNQAIEDERKRRVESSFLKCIKANGIALERLDD